MRVTKPMLFHLFDTLEAHCSGTALPQPHAELVEDQDVCLFVTWNKHGQMGGCKGITGGPRSLRQLLGDFAIDAATNDSRFEPLQKHDLPHLECHLNLLHSFEDTSHQEWEVGVHGIKIAFKADNRRYSATFLPFVASSQNWNQKQTLEQLIKKAGYRGAITPALLEQMHVVRYRTAEGALRYDQWLEEWKKQKEKKSVSKKKRKTSI